MKAKRLAQNAPSGGSADDERRIRISCQGATTAELEDLIPLQGGLKRLDNDGYRKLKRVLLEHGFSFPFFVWKDHGKLFILDGHQRDVALKRLKAQGYGVPPLPIDYIEAKNEKEAREKILLLSSQYGKMTDETLLEYLKQSQLDIDDLLDTVDLPTVNLEKLSEQLLNELQENNQISEPQHQFQVIIECSDEEQQLTLIEELEKRKYTCRALIL